MVHPDGKVRIRSRSSTGTSLRVDDLTGTRHPLPSGLRGRLGGISSMADGIWWHQQQRRLDNAGVQIMPAWKPICLRAGWWQSIGWRGWSS